MHHFVSLLLHALNAALLFVLLKKWIARENETRSTIAAAAGSLIYAIHPLRVEAVAWMSCQPYLLSTAFSLLCMIGYTEWTLHGNSKWKLVSILAFACALMSKAIPLALPAALVLLDLWPLQRLSIRAGPRVFISRAFLEKWPFWALSIGIAALAAIGKSHGMQTFEQHALSHRIVQSFYALAFYAWKTAWPSALSPLYPFPPIFHMEGRFVVGIFFVLFLTGFLFWKRHAFPEGLWTWCIFAVLASPVLGLMQAGPQLAADRYTYLPALATGLLVSAILCRIASVRVFQIALIACIGISLLFAAIARQQFSYWKDSVSLWKRALDIGPASVTALNNYGNALIEARRPAEAIPVFGDVIRMNPSHVEAYNNLGIAHAELKDWTHAIQAYQAALQHNPCYAEAYGNLANALSEIGQPTQALDAYQKAIELDPKNPDTLCNFGLTLLHERRWKESAAVLEKALAIWPHHANTLYALAWLRAASPDPYVHKSEQAFELAQRLKSEMPEHPKTYDALGVVFADRGQFEEAQRLAEHALQLAQGDEKLQKEIAERIALYRQRRAYLMP